MKIRLPLYARILGWFFLNLLLLAVVFYGFFRFQFHVGLDSLLAGRAGDRIDAVGSLIGEELHEKPVQFWNAVLDRFDAAYRVQFTLFRPDGGQVAGSTVNLPPEVKSRLESIRNRRPPRRNLPPGDLPGLSLPPPGSFEPRLEGRPEPPPPTPRTKIILKAGDPSRYWILSSIPLPPSPELPEHGPVTLVIVSDQLSAGGLVFDPTPWLAVGVGVIILSVLFWLPLVHGITHAISQMTAATTRIAAGDFESRSPDGRSDEIGSLGASINRMAARLAGFIQGQKRFLGDTAHELVSPLARMEMALSILDQRAAEKDRPYLQDVHEEVRLMSGLVDELLSFSKASLGASNIHLQAVPLLELAEKTVHREGVENVEISIPPDCKVQADPELLQRALGNVVRNAFRHGGSATKPAHVRISVVRENNEIALTVSDEGPGIPESALSEVFDPFFRLDLSRDRATGGTGLGLAITKTCVESCGGRVSCRNRQPHGLEVMFRLRAE